MNRAGEDKPDLSPAICFFKLKNKRTKDEEVDVEYIKELITIKVAADSSAPLDQMISTLLLFEPIASFLISGVLFTEHLLKLQQEVFDRNGKTGPQDVAYCLSFIRRLLKQKARQEFEVILFIAHKVALDDHFGDSDEDQ